MINEVGIARLSRPISPGDLRDLVAIDRSLMDELGVRFSSEKWDEPQFSMVLPGKWRFSRVAYSAGLSRRIVAYWIASLRSPKHLHTHRVGVEEGARDSSGVGTALFSAVVDEAASRKVRTLTLSVHELNQAAMSFYGSLGFTALEGDSLERFAQSKGAGFVDARRERLVVDGSHQCILQFDLGGAK